MAGAIRRTRLGCAIASTPHLSLKSGQLDRIARADACGHIADAMLNVAAGAILAMKTVVALADTLLALAMVVALIRTRRVLAMPTGPSLVARALASNADTIGRAVMGAHLSVAVGAAPSGKAPDSTCGLVDYRSVDDHADLAVFAGPPCMTFALAVLAHTIAPAFVGAGDDGAALSSPACNAVAGAGFEVAVAVATAALALGRVRAPAGAVVCLARLSSEHGVAAAGAVQARPVSGAPFGAHEPVAVVGRSRPPACGTVAGARGTIAGAMARAHAWACDLRAVRSPESVGTGALTSGKLAGAVAGAGVVGTRAVFGLARVAKVVARALADMGARAVVHVCDARCRVHAGSVSVAVLCTDEAIACDTAKPGSTHAGAILARSVQLAPWGAGFDVASNAAPAWVALACKVDAAAVV